MEFLKSLKQRTEYYGSPFDHWELDKPLTKESVKEICKTEIKDLTKMNVRNFIYTFISLNIYNETV